LLELDQHLEGLNSAQLEAVHKFNKPLLILAGAGTGKTKVIVSKIAHIIKSNLAWPNEILAVTFTNKAAKEMSERIEKLIDFSQPFRWLGTFHSIAAKILRLHQELVGLSSNFLIIDTDDQLKLIKSILNDKNLDPQQYNPKLLLAIINSWKDQAIMPSKITSSDTTSLAAQVAKDVYKTYQERLKASNLVDFGDLLLYNLELFTNNSDILEQYQNKFKFILVDEYQDTNVAQYLWLRLLAQRHSNICCVGDDDQSIYGWRGAKIENILRFEKDFPGAHVIKLEQNYRSSKYILQAASALISNNAKRYGKTLWTSDEKGQKVIVNSFWNDLEEAKYVSLQIKQKAHNIYRPSNISILVRASFQTRVIEEAFIAQGIPYIVIGNMKFYERMEVKDIIAYIRLAINKNDDLAFERIINKPKRGVGDSTIQKLKQHALINNCSLLDAISIMIEKEPVKAQLKNNLLEFKNYIYKWHNLFDSISHGEAVITIIEDVRYFQMLESEKESKEDASNRIENIKELIKAIEEFDSIYDFLEHISLVSSSDDVSLNNKVNIMTLHAAKGLEFDLVFLPGWEEGLFPNGKTLEETGNHGLEEERRLAYVGITRAKHELHISSVYSRRVFNQWQYNSPSRFIMELPTDCCVIGVNVTTQQSQVTQSPYNASYNAVPSSNFSINQRVIHNKFGQGVIVKLEGNSADVFFDDLGTKKIMLSFLKNHN
jgi:DNA helicase-2/ATP-dependent DNA helicase PcrA